MGKINFKSFIDVRIRFSDMDSLGHVNNAVYLSYFEEARVHYFRELLDLPSIGSTSPGMIVLETHCTYKTPAYYGETLRIYSKVSWMKNKSFEMRYAAIEIESGRTVAEGSSILVAYDYQTGQTVPIPESVRSRISAFENISSSLA